MLLLHCLHALFACRLLLTYLALHWAQSLPWDR